MSSKIQLLHQEKHILETNPILKCWNGNAAADVSCDRNSKEIQNPRMNCSSELAAAVSMSSQLQQQAFADMTDGQHMQRTQGEQKNSSTPRKFL